MPALVYVTGWEHGLVSISGGGLANDTSNASISSTTVRTGTYSVRINTAASTGYWEKTIDTPSNILVVRFYVRFATLPSANCLIFNDDNASTNAGIGYRQATQQFCTMLNSVYGAAGGPVITTGVWYRIDCKIDASTGTLTVDGAVDGTALTQSSGAFASATFNAYKLGPNDTSVTSDIFFDDFIVSNTVGDYPLGAGYVRGYSPNAVGTHNLDASTSVAFFRDGGGGEVAITNVESVSWQQLDDIPLSADEDRVLVKNHASLTAAHYLEYGFANSSEAGAIQGVRGLVTLRQDTPANCAIVARLREGGSDATIYSGDVNNDFRIYKGATFATKPSGGDWSDSTFDATTLRWGFTTDADGVVRLDSALLEVAFGDAPESDPTVTHFSILGRGAGW